VLSRERFNFSTAPSVDGLLQSRRLIAVMQPLTPTWA
jgi:hypothetical protein